MARRELDIPSLVAGLAIVVLGTVLLLDRLDVLTLRFAALGAAGVRGPRSDPARDGPRAPRLVPARWDHGREDGHAPCSPTPGPGPAPRHAAPDARRRVRGARAALGVDPIIVRVAFVAAATAGGVGVASTCSRGSSSRRGEAPAGPVWLRTSRGTIEVVLGIGFLAAQRPAHLPRVRPAVLGRDRLAARARRGGRRAALAPVARRRAPGRHGGRPRRPPACRARAPPRPPGGATGSAAAAPRTSTERAALVSRTSLGIALVIAAGIVFLRPPARSAPRATSCCRCSSSRSSSA